MTETRTISLSLVSHTNVGKTTLARTLLGRDIGIVRDEAHVTESAEEHTLVQTPQGDRLTLWDTPGFGDSARLARRLESAGDPIGWFVGQVWDRFRDRALWSNQQAVRNVRERADVVLYLVNASEPLAQARYIDDEMRVLDWIGKPVIVLLNQLGAPRPAADEAAELDEWRRHLAAARPVRAVLPLDAFARCWVQEATLLRAIVDVLEAEQRPAALRLIDEWLRMRRRVFDESIDVLAQALAQIAGDRETINGAGMLGRLRGAAQALSRSSSPDAQAVPAARRQAMRALAQRLDDALRAATDRLIALHGLGGHASGEIIERLAEHYRVSSRLPEGRAAVLGGVLTGALAGLKADLATGGFSFGAGILGGSLLGAMGAFGLARGYNLVRGGPAPAVTWSDAVLDESCAAALLSYLAVAHYGRGRGEWSASEHPPHWLELVQSVLEAHHEIFEHAWSLRGEEGGEALLASALRPALSGAALDVLARLYPEGVRDSKLLVPERVADAV